MSQSLWSKRRTSRSPEVGDWPGQLVMLRGAGTVDLARRPRTRAASTSARSRPSSPSSSTPAACSISPTGRLRRGGMSCAIPTSPNGPTRRRGSWDRTCRAAAGAGAAVLRTMAVGGPCRGRQTAGHYRGPGATWPASSSPRSCRPQDAWLRPWPNPSHPADEGPQPQHALGCSPMLRGAVALELARCVGVPGRPSGRPRQSGWWRPWQPSLTWGNTRAGGGTRTHDLTITSRLRYQLRHTGGTKSPDHGTAGRASVGRAVTSRVAQVARRPARRDASPPCTPADEP